MSTGHDPHLRPSIAVGYDHRRDQPAAEQLAAELSLPMCKGFRDPRDLHLVIDERGWLCLRVNQPGHALLGGHDVAADVLSIDTQSSAGRAINTPFYKSLGIRKGEPHRPHILDATAGLGEDAWLMASAGCHVTCLERDPIVHALLRDALRRAAEASPGIAQRLTLLHGSLTDLATTIAPIEAVYLDPMFPQAATGRRAVERKPMRVLRWLVGDDDDADALWSAAMQLATRRVIVKRPRLGPLLGTKSPTHRHMGKALRYDMYAIASTPPEAHAAKLRGVDRHKSSP